MALFSKRADDAAGSDPVDPDHDATPPAADDSSVSWRDDRVGSSARGENPMVMLELASGWAVIGDTQFLPGYSVLISRHRDAAMLSELTREQRLQFLADLDLLATAVERACIEKDPAFRRVNIEILGNADEYVHAHVFPRYEWEGPKAKRPVWDYRESHWTDELHEYKSGHEPLRLAITAELRTLAGIEEPPEQPLAQPDDVALDGPSSTEPEPAVETGAEPEAERQPAAEPTTAG